MRRLSLIIPLLVLLAMLVFEDEGQGAIEAQGAGQVTEEASAEEDQARLVVLIIDSLRRPTLEQDGVMPHLSGLANREGVESIDVTTCEANFTYPCLQTRFEGRQSPFVAGLHNFTGRASEVLSIPAALEARGDGVGMISNISMISLYGHYGVETIQVEDWDHQDPEMDLHLERDLRSMPVASEWAQQQGVDHLMVHLLGTDKAAHAYQPGDERYEDHFRRVDEASGAFVDTLDLSRDHLLITGDHGHDEDGHHTRESVAIMAGPHWEQLWEVTGVPEELDQTELTYFMALATGVNLPMHYEGRHFALEGEAAQLEGSPVERFVERWSLQLEETGYDTSELSEAIAEHRAALQQEHQLNLVRYLPVLALFFLWMISLEGRLRGAGEQPRGLWVDLGFGAAALATWILSTPVVAVALGWTAVYLGAALWWSGHYGGLRHLSWLLLVLGATAAIGFHVQEWTEFFHTRGGFVAGQPVFYTMLPVVGLVLARIYHGDWRRAPEGAMGFCLFALPSGVYYYQFGQNMFWGFLLASALVWVVYAVMQAGQKGLKSLPLAALSRPLVVLPVAVLVATTVLLLMQESGGWEWRYFPARWLRDGGVWWIWGCYGGLGVYLAALLRRPAQKVGMLVYLGVSAAVAVSIGDMPAHEFVAAHVVVAFIASWLMVGDSPLALMDKKGRYQREGLVLLGASLAMGWFLLGGFFIHNLDFQFGFEYFGGLEEDRFIFGGVFALTFLKYGLPIGALWLFYRLHRGAGAQGLSFRWFAYYSLVAMLALFVQIFFSAVGSTEKLYELAVAQVVFLFLITLIVYAFVWVSDLVGPRAKAG